MIISSLPGLLKYIEHCDVSDMNVDVHLEDVDQIALLTDDEDEMDDQQNFTVLSAYGMSAPETAGDDVRYSSDTGVGVDVGGEEMQSFP